MRICSTPPAPRCTPRRAAMAPRRRNETAAMTPR
jgi:hypothetical protein